MIKFRKSEERGFIDHGWLQTYHTFSFADYYDEKFVRYRTLRVLNDDRIAPSQGFGTHPHRDMEIITYILSGELAHKDNTGESGIIRAGEVQRMSAGSGVFHSERNPSAETTVHLLQIWIFPAKKGVAPSYEQKRFDRGEKLNRWRLIASDDGRDGSVTIGQDAAVYATVLEPDKELTVTANSGRGTWLHVATGEVRLGDTTLSAGDASAIEDEAELTLHAVSESELLMFDLA